MEVHRVSVPQSVQTQHEGHVVLQQTGVWCPTEGEVQQWRELVNICCEDVHTTCSNTEISKHRAYKETKLRTTTISFCVRDAGRYLCGPSSPPANVWCPGN